MSTEFASPNRFLGKLKKVDVSLGASSLSEEDEKKVRATAVAAH